MYYTTEERVFLIEQVFRNGDRYTQCVKEKFRVKFPGKVVPHRDSVRDLVKRFRESGSVEDRPRSGRPPKTGSNDDPDNPESPTILTDSAGKQNRKMELINHLFKDNLTKKPRKIQTRGKLVKLKQKLANQKPVKVNSNTVKPRIVRIKSKDEVEVSKDDELLEENETAPPLTTSIERVDEPDLIESVDDVPEDVTKSPVQSTERTVPEEEPVKDLPTSKRALTTTIEEVIEPSAESPTIELQTDLSLANKDLTTVPTKKRHKDTKLITVVIIKKPSASTTTTIEDAMDEPSSNRSQSD